MDRDPKNIKRLLTSLPEGEAKSSAATEEAIRRALAAGKAERDAAKADGAPPICPSNMLFH
jgi:hypothetical protein